MKPGTNKHSELDGPAEGPPRSLSRYFMNATSASEIDGKITSSARRSSS